MTPAFMDCNVLLDAVTDDPRWHGWSALALQEVGDAAHLVINPVIFAEVSVRYAAVEDAEAAFPASLVACRRRSGTRCSPLPDCFIGAHAAVAGYRLLTRDPARYRGYFPTVPLIAPD